MQNLSGNAIRINLQAWKRKGHRIRHRWAERSDGHPSRQVSGSRSEDVTSVEGVADLGQAVTWIGQFDQYIHRLAGHHVTEDAVVRPDEGAHRRAQRDGPPCTSHAWVHHDEVYRVRREKGIGGVEHVGSLADVLRCDFVGDVHQLDVGNDAENDAFHRPYVAVGCTKVSREGNQKLSSFITPVHIKTTRSQMLLTRSAMRSSLWATHNRYVARVIVVGSPII